MDLDALLQGGLGSSQSSSVSVQESPEGIRVEVTEIVDGEESVQVYEGSDRESLLETYPELEPHLGEPRRQLRAPGR